MPGSEAALRNASSHPQNHILFFANTTMFLWCRRKWILTVPGYATGRVKYRTSHTAGQGWFHPDAFDLAVLPLRGFELRRIQVPPRGAPSYPGKAARWLLKPGELTHELTALSSTQTVPHCWATTLIYGHRQRVFENEHSAQEEGQFPKRPPY